MNGSSEGRGQQPGLVEPCLTALLWINTSSVRLNKFILPMELT